MATSRRFSGRSLTSFAKVQALVGWLSRNRGFQLNRPRAQKRYLDVGCGRNAHAGFVNLDYLWHPGVDVCWDIRRGLPFADASMSGVFSEHCLEHFPPADARRLLREIRRVLAPEGLARIVVPDAELYLRTYVRRLDGDTTQRFPYEEAEARQPGWSPVRSVNRIFYQDRESPFGHHVIYDFQALQLLLQECGFDRVRRCQFMAGADPVLLIDSPERRVESLYVEASPGTARS